MHFRLVVLAGAWDKGCTPRRRANANQRDQTMIQQIETNTGPAFTVEARGVSYYLRLDTFGRWELSSQRLALAAARMGGTVRHFASLDQVEATVKAFRGLGALVAL